MNKLKPRTQRCFRRTTFSSNKVQYWATWNVSHCTSCKTILPLDIPDLFFFIFDNFVLCLITANYFLEMGFPASGSCGKKMLSCFFPKRSLSPGPMQSSWDSNQSWHLFRLCGKSAWQHWYCSVYPLAGLLSGDILSKPYPARLSRHRLLWLGCQNYILHSLFS